MKKRSENCWLMHSRMVAAVATTSAQRQAPRKRAHARDLGLLQVADAGVRIVELDPFAGAATLIGGRMKQ